MAPGRMINASDGAPDLARLQADFQAWVLGLRAARPAVIDRAEGAAVYAEAYLLRHGEALAADFPALHALLGETGFHEMAREYSLAHPSPAPSIRWFGRHLPAFLASAAPWAAEPYLTELAALEWAAAGAFDGGNAPTLQPADLAAVPAEHWHGVVLEFHPTVRRINLEFEVVALWKGLLGDGGTPTLPARPAPRAWLLWRPDLDVRYRELADREHLALDAMVAGAAFGEAAERLVAAGAALPDEVPGLLAGWTLGWVRAGLIARARAGESLTAEGSQT